MKPKFFDTKARFRAWLDTHHATKTEIVVGYYKKGTGKPSITWPESVDEALCFGWIDGVRRSLGDEAYSIRFTPRKSRSIWSLVNVARVKKLEQAGKMTPAGRRAFEARTPARTGLSSFERRTPARLSPADEKKLRANAKAAAFFYGRPPWYRRAALHWVVSAKREETQARRLDQLIRDSARGKTVPPLTRPGQKPAGKR
jgi:uncharacterized protein YdeI (YjbR/CyaY-like superfamily)